MEEKGKTNNRWVIQSITLDNLKDHTECLTKTGMALMTKRNTIGMAVSEMKNDKPEKSGALIAEIQKGRALLVSIYIKPEYREQGCGSFLLNNFLKLLNHLKVQEVAIEYPYPDMRELEHFLTQRGFTIQSEENKIYTVKVSDLEMAEFLTEKRDSYPGQILSVAELTEQQRYRWLSRFGNDLPSEFSPKEVDGSFLPERSMVSVRNGNVEAFTICSQLEEGVVYLAALYSAPSAIKALFPLIQKTLLGILEHHSQEMLCFAGATEAGIRLIDHLCRNYLPLFDIQTMRTAVWKPSSKEAITVESFDREILMARLYGLSANLEELGIEHDVVASVDQYPGILIEREAGVLQLKYLIVSLEEQEHFLLNVSTIIKKPDLNEFSLQLLCEEYNQTSLFLSVWKHPMEPTLLFKASVPETEGIHQGDRLQFVLDLCADGLQQWNRMVQNYKI